MSALLARERRQDRNTSAALTIVLHVLLAILFLFIGLTEWDPPIPEDVVEVEMFDGGGGEVGGGSSQPETNSQPAPTAEESDPEDVATDDESDVEVVKPVTPKPKPKPTPTKPKVDRRLENALNNWNTTTETQNTTPTTNPDPGPGGTGKGLFKGSGWELRGGGGPGGGGGTGSGRGLAKGPDLSERPPLENPTWVEVKVIADPSGNVLRVSVANTGTPDVAIQNVALRAAKTVRFVAVPNAPPEVAYYIKLRFVPS